MNCKVKQGCLTSESCCILLWLAFTLFPVSVVTAADNRKIDESQQKEVKAEMKGYVGDENGEPVIGATVLESGTQNGVITDVDGIFTIQLAKNASLTISYVGYQKKTVVVKDKKFISVNLTPDRSMMLDEVVVVGFGKQKKESLVGAVQAVKPEDLKMTSSNLSTSFAGNVPGIIAVQTQGELLPEIERNPKYESERISPPFPFEAGSFHTERRNLWSGGSLLHGRVQYPLLFFKLF